jgi:alkylated DNA repair dioxygenase AlkB
MVSSVEYHSTETLKNAGMDLFEHSIDKTKNWLPQDGTVHYYGKLFTATEANYYFDKLLTGIEWRNDEAMMFGKKIITRRKVAWYGEKPFEYTYSNITKYALPWTKELLELKTAIEKETGETFNSCLLNLYHHGEEGMAWHSDGEPDLKKNGAIASLSFGAERKFAFKHKQTNQKVELILEHGSLLIMKDTTQTHWLHRLPPTKRITTARVNLTFRTIVD